MQIILLNDVESLGMAGEILSVAPGYARNYLLPQNLALLATEGNLRKLAKKRAEYELRAKEVREQAVILKDKIEAIKIIIRKKDGERGKLYGAVTAQEIVDGALKLGVEIDRKRMRLGEPIKLMGDYDIPIRLMPEITAIAKVSVVPERTDAEDAESIEENSSETTES